MRIRLPVWGSSGLLALGAAAGALAATAFRPVASSAAHCAVGEYQRRFAQEAVLRERVTTCSRF